MNKYFVTGGWGKLGTELRKFLNCVAPRSAEANILNMDALEKAVVSSGATAIVHLAAISDAKLADKDRMLSYRTNVIGTRNVAAVAKKLGLKIFYVSTDYVFDGKEGNYSEESIPNPPNWYGFTKYAGELEVLSSGASHCIIRTSFRPANWGFPSAFTNVYTSADYTDVIGNQIAKCITMNVEGIIHIGTPVKTFYDLAARRTPGIKPEECPDPAFPKKRNLNISKWQALSKKGGA